MPDLPEKKAGIIACSGEELAEGTVSRLAALKVLHETRPDRTVTLCLPLFLAGGRGERAFARFYPTITVDGCGLKCAARATERYSAPPAASLVVSEIAAARGIGAISGRRALNEAGRKAVEAVAASLEREVDRVLKAPGESRTGAGPADSVAPSRCSCGSCPPSSSMRIAGRDVEIAAWPALLDAFLEAGGRADDAGVDELVRQVAVYNAIPSGEAAAWREAIGREIERRIRERTP